MSSMYYSTSMNQFCECHSKSVSHAETFVFILITVLHESYYGIEQLEQRRHAVILHKLPILLEMHDILHCILMHLIDQPDCYSHSRRRRQLQDEFSLHSRYVVNPGAAISIEHCCQHGILMIVAARARCASRISSTSPQSAGNPLRLQAHVPQLHAPAPEAGLREHPR